MALLSIAERIWKRVRQDTTSTVFNASGEAILDDTPVAIPVGMQIPETLDQKLARMFRTQKFLDSLEAEGLETFEEASDLDIDDDDDDVQLTSIYQGPNSGKIASAHAYEKDVVAAPDIEGGKAAQERIRSQKAAKKAAKEVSSTDDPESPSE